MFRLGYVALGNLPKRTYFSSLKKGGLQALLFHTYTKKESQVYTRTHAQVSSIDNYLPLCLFCK